MKDLMSRIKTLDYKQFALNHGEKIGMGIVGLTVAIVCLLLTSWASEYSGDPREMATKADDIAFKLKQNRWTEERQKEFPFLLAEDELKRVEDQLDILNYEWPVDFS